MLKITDKIGFAALSEVEAGNDSNTVLLVQFNGINGNAGPYTDVSRAGNDGNGHSLTPGSEATIDGLTVSPLQNGYEVLNTTGSATEGKILLPVHSDFNFGDGEFTIDTWLRFTTTASAYVFAAALSNGMLSSAAIQINYVSGAITGTYNSEGNNYRISSGSGFNDGNWHHVAFCRDEVFRLYIDGIQRASDATARTLTDAAGAIAIGGVGLYQTGLGYDGKTEELRVSRICRYPNGIGFSPPETAYGPIAR